MALLTAVELRRIEKRFPDGIGSADAVRLFREKGERFSEATLRKYVQLGLLPKSRRVGTRGRHRGSSGRYPVAIIRIINDIKAALDAGATLEELRVGRVGRVGELEALQRATDQVMNRFDEAIDKHSDRKRKTTMKKVLSKHRKVLQREAKELSRLAVELGTGPRS